MERVKVFPSFDMTICLDDIRSVVSLTSKTIIEVSFRLGTASSIDILSKEDPTSGVHTIQFVDPCPIGWLETGSVLIRCDSAVTLEPVPNEGAPPVCPHAFCPTETCCMELQADGTVRLLSVTV